MRCRPGSKTLSLSENPFTTNFSGSATTFEWLIVGFLRDNNVVSLLITLGFAYCGFAYYGMHNELLIVGFAYCRMQEERSQTRISSPKKIYLLKLADRLAEMQLGKKTLFALKIGPIGQPPVLP